MVKQSVKKIILNSLSSIPGWHTKRKLVILESDDWGSIRMPSKAAFDILSTSGIDLLSDDGARYNRFDSLATSDDLSSLFEVLNSVKDSSGRSAVMTPVSVVANPDFTRIMDSGFTEYFFEPFVETLKKYPGCENSFRLWKEGIAKRIFMPQFHGREHLNINVWLKALKSGNRNSIIAFDNRMWGISTANDPEVGVELQAAFDFLDPKDILVHNEVIISGLNLFEELFGYRASYFVPPNGPLSSKLETTCSKEGIRLLSVPKLQVEPLGNGRTRKRFHWLGKRSSSGLTYLTRNCFFEPGQSGKDWTDSCLSDIKTAFNWNKPAVISSHRVNYIGALSKNNRDDGLFQLALLLQQVIKSWPDVEFITTAELNTIMNDV
jgi:hypothetical protein